MIFTFKEDFKIPVFSNSGLLEHVKLFPKDIFGLGYTIKTFDPLNKVLKLRLCVRRLSDKFMIEELGQLLIIDENGQQGSLINGEEIDEHTREKENLESEIAKFLIVEKEHLKNIAALEKDDSIGKEEKQVEIENLNNSFSLVKKNNNNLSLELQRLNKNPVIPEYNVINRYDEVVGAYFSDGIITEKGVQWAINFPLGDGMKILDFIELPN